MRAVSTFLATSSRTLSYFLGGAVIVLALATMMTSVEVADIARWAWHVFGVTFLVLLASLVFVALFCWTRLQHGGEASASRKFWLEAGVHAANGIATLALTYTLLGISLGIAQLADQELTPATVQAVIRGITDQFSLAFLTTVIGLPTSSILRVLLLVTNARLEARLVPAHSSPVHSSPVHSSMEGDRS